MFMFEFKKDIKEISNREYIVQFISADYRLTSKPAQELDRLYDIRNSLFRKYPTCEYHYRHCLQTGQVLNVVLRYFHWGKANERDLILSLQNLRAYCEERQIYNLVMPKALCCDDFEWLTVYQCISDVFNGWSGTIHVLMEKDANNVDDEPAA